MTRRALAGLPHNLTPPYVIGRAFIDDYLDLTGGVWVRCTFDGCIVHLGGLAIVSGCIFKNCKYTGDWPKEWVGG